MQIMTGNVISNQYAVLKPGSGGMKIYQKDFLKSSENQAVYMY